MDARQFLSEFAHVVSTPNGVNHLRSMILALAFRGSLAEYVDEDISDLLTSLHEQRVNTRVALRKSWKPLTTEKTIQPLFLIPEHWRWLSLGEVGHSWGQKTPTTDFTYIDVSSIDNRSGVISRSLTVLKPDQAPSRARKIVQRDTVIYSTVRPYLLNIAVIDCEFKHEPIASTAFAIIHPWEGILPKYIYYYLRCPYFIAYVQSVQIGVAYPAISDEKFFSGLIPIPPTPEQERIVAKVDELMALCNKLEVQIQTRSHQRRVSGTAILNSLTTADDLDTLRAHWHRLQTNMLLFENEEEVASLKRAIIDLGVRGWLTESSSPHNELEEAAISRLEELARTGKIKKRKWISDRHVLNKFDLSTIYAKSYLGNIAELITDGEHATPKRISNGRIPLVTAKNVRDGFFDLADTDFVGDETALKAWTRCKPKHDDILMVCVGATIGRLLVAKSPKDMVIVRSVALIRMFSDLFLPEFVAYCLQSSWGQRQIWGNVKQSAQPCIYLNRIAQIQITVPPFDEQQRIVEVLDNMLNTCDKLRMLSNTASLTAAALASASIDSITGVNVKVEKKMKIPKTELVSTLRIGISPINKDHAPLAAILLRNNGELAAKTLWNMSGLEGIDAFYQQLRTEMAKGWIVQPEVAHMKEVESN